MTYFVTFCTEHRRISLTTPEILVPLDHERRVMETDGTWRVRAWVVMPDHVHVLFELGMRLPLGRVVARIKSRSSPILKSRGLNWRSGYFEHRLRTADEVPPTLYYIIMNPIRASLAEHGEEWPGFHCCEEDWGWFAYYARQTVVEPQWLLLADGVASKLAPTTGAKEPPRSTAP